MENLKQFIPVEPLLENRWIIKTHPTKIRQTKL